MDSDQYTVSFAEICYGRADLFDHSSPLMSDYGRIRSAYCSGRDPNNGVGCLLEFGRRNIVQPDIADTMELQQLSSHPPPCLPAVFFEELFRPGTWS